MYHPPLVAEDFEVPVSLETDRMRLRPLAPEHCERDFDAVVSSEVRLQTVFRPGEGWPTGLTLEQNALEMAWHLVEFQNRTSFAYTVLAPDEARVLGCVYFYPSFHPDFDVSITMWVRESEADSGLDEHLYETVRLWAERDWPFSNPAYPGRTVSWSAWRNAGAI